jgi:hypothetical protein
MVVLNIAAVFRNRLARSCKGVLQSPRGKADGVVCLRKGVLRRHRRPEARTLLLDQLYPNQHLVGSIPGTIFGVFHGQRIIVHNAALLKLAPLAANIRTSARVLIELVATAGLGLIIF